VLMTALCSLFMVLCALPAAAAETGELVRRDIRDIVVTSDGTVYVLDGKRRQVIKFDKSGKSQWSVAIETPGKRERFLSTMALASKSPWNLLVMAKGEPLRDVSADGKVTDLVDLATPYPDCITAVDGMGRFYIPNKDKSRVEIYDPNLPGVPPADRKSVV
jgi:hypothetical protein